MHPEDVLWQPALVCSRPPGPGGPFERLRQPAVVGEVVAVAAPPVLKTLFGVKDRVERPDRRGPAIEGIGG